MDAFTRSQLLALSEGFYRAQAEAFDASRGHHAWPGWERLAECLRDTAAEYRASRTNDLGSGKRALRVLDVGCGNARLARFLADAAFDVDYVGVDANAALLDAARDRLPADLREQCRLIQHDFLASGTPGADLPEGPFDLVVLMGVMHHVPGSDWRLALLRAASARLASDGILALATWQFALRDRFEKRRVEWSSLAPVLDRPIDESRLEGGDRLLRFGDDPSAPPRYCHQVADPEFESWPDALGMEALAEFRADGAEGDLNRYLVLRRPPDAPGPD